MIVIIGGRHTGKTFWVLKVVEGQKKKVLLVDVNNEKKYRNFPLITLDQLPRWKSGVYRIIPHDPEALLLAIDRHLKNTMVVFEDAGKYIDGNLDRPLKSLLIGCRHVNVDIIFPFQSFGLVPPRIFQLSNYIVVKKTSDTIRQLRQSNKIPNPDQVIKAWETVSASRDPFIQIEVATHA